MQDKESIAGMSWLVLLIIACWGGLVRYLMDVKQSKQHGAGSMLLPKWWFQGLPALLLAW
jgi:hypothetical protein